MASGIVSVIHCDTKCNLADMGTKALNGTGHQHLLQNQVIPPTLTVGECKTDSQTKVTLTCLVFSVLSPLDQEIATSCENSYFVARLARDNFSATAPAFCNKTHKSLTDM